MEAAVVVPPKRRGRKRKKQDLEDGDGKKKPVVTRSLRLVGRYVRKEFEGSGVFLGKIMSYNSGLYRINYEDGDFEDLDSGEVKMFLVEECDLIGEWAESREKLDKYLLGKSANGEVLKVENALEMGNVNQSDLSLVSDLRNGEAGVENVNQVSLSLTSEQRNGEAGVENVNQVDSSLLSNERNGEFGAEYVNWDASSLLSEVRNGEAGVENVNQVDSTFLSEVRNGEAGAHAVVENHDDGDSDSSNDSCGDTRERDYTLLLEEPLVPPPELPPSSGDIGVPEEYVSHLLSVYSFLRSFSVPLFLFPFGLDDFVGALNCSVANTLLDSIHVALLHVLKRHIEMISSEGSELALKCTRILDWKLLDNLTWPIYLVHYLIAMGYKNGSEWRDFYAHSLEKDYYTLSAGKKLTVLQILCDDILYSEELRAEMDMREESEVGIDMDTSTTVRPTGASRRVHPRYSKTSVSKEIDAIKNFTAHHEIKASLGNHSTQVGGQVGSSADDDSNGDECRICGMDGLLICCDGCPSSYHSRCIGVSKMHMPEGSWYCPECKINETEPKIMQGTTLRGGQCFGVDTYGQLFIATCDHLLVLNASIDSGVCLRYYSRPDIPRALHALCTRADHVVLYAEICRGVLQYWQLPPEILPLNEMSEVGVQLEIERGSSVCSCLDNFLGNSMTHGTEVEKTGSCITTVSAADKSASSLMNCVQEPFLSGNSLFTVTKSVQMGNSDNAGGQSGLIINTILAESNSAIGLTGQPVDTNGSSQQSSSNVTETSYSMRNRNVNCSGPVNGASREVKIPLLSLEPNNRVHKVSYEDPCDSSLYIGSSFKTNSYINNYLHGDFAASAAVNLAVLLSEENQILESRSSNNRRRVISDNISLQIKAFSSVSMRFFWPNSEKKLVDIPRERCSWCFSCKAAVASKRGCLLNAAASNVIRGAMKVLGGRPVKNGDGRLPGIAAHIMFMEESLSGLVVGPFQSDTFRKRWRKQVEQATTCNAIKILLLELEENIRTIALSGDWIKLVDGCPTQSSTSQILTNAAGSTQKRGPGRRGRKTSTVVEVAMDDCQDLSTDFTWWRGGTLSKLMFQRGILPCSMIRKAARQGISKKIPGIHYVEGLETPKISRRLIWRSAVEMSRNIAQLALQVRNLDLHVRWSDLVRPEQNPPDGKGPEAEASAFRNASICDKKIVEGEIRYCIAFGSQKHLPSRLMKNIAEIEQHLDEGKERYWFSETRIPLYLIKEYEGKVGKGTNVDMSKLQMRQRKPSQKNIFLSLSRKQDNMVKTNCASCHHDVLYSEAVNCTSCQGFCHEQCITSSTVHNNMEVELLITCKNCSESQVASQVQVSYGSPTSPLLLQGQDFPKAGTSRKRGKLVGNKGPSASGGTLEHTSEMKSSNGSATVKKSNNKNWGLKWGKKLSDDAGFDFRLKNIIPRGNPDMDLTNPVCCLCNNTYNPEFMYIRCEKCTRWFHADALELDESKISLLMGFKCSRCRRIRHPVCPYLEPEKKKALEDKIESKAAKLEMCETDVYSRPPDHVMEEAPVYSVLPKEELEQFTNAPEVDYEWNISNVSHSGPRKLPIRRHIKQENNIFCPPIPDPFQVNISAPYEANVLNSNGKLPVRRQIKRENSIDSAVNSLQVEEFSPLEVNAMDSFSSDAQWNVSNGSFDDGMALDYDNLGFDDMDFEPQTFFSFHELLASDDGSHANINESPADATLNLDKSSMLPENGTLEISYDEEEPVISLGSALDFVPCNICSHADPYPDLSCQMCGVWIHSHCSPWLESPSWESGWTCGVCRAWR